MADRTYYVIDPEGKLTCRKCGLKLIKDRAKFMYLDNGFPVELPYTLEFTDEARRLMDERMILIGDVIAVMDATRENGEIIEDADSGFLIARHRLGNVTFWVAFTETEGGYLIRRAYSHRMRVVPGNG